MIAYRIFTKLKMKKLAIIILPFIFFSIFVFAEGHQDSLRIHFIDVGEGDSIFIEAPNGKTTLVDGGNLITGFRVVEYLKRDDIQNLDHLIFTHPHLDHIGGSFFILQMMKIKKIYDNGEDLTGIAKSQDIYRWYVELVRGDENYRILKAGDVLSLGEVILKVLWPPQPLVFADWNANSLVMMVEYGKFRCLLAGDLTTVGERRLLEQGVDLKADTLKVGHHGAKDGSCEEFLKAVACKIAIITVNKDNIRGYPSTKVLERFQDLGARIYRTDKNGDIVITVNGNGNYSIETEK